MRSNYWGLFFMIVALSGVRCAKKPQTEPAPPPKRVSIEKSCFHKNKSFIGQYFFAHKASAKSHTSDLDRFFNCMDNLIQALLNHTQTKNPEYYTKAELTRFILYMGGVKKAKTEQIARAKAQKMSQALLHLKVGFIGGRVDRLTLKEIALSRKILFIFKEQMRLLWPSIPTLLQAVRGQAISKSTLMQTMQTVQARLRSLSADLSRLSFSADLSFLEKAPKNIQILTGMSPQTLKYWSPSVLILAQWQKIFGSSKQVIKSSELPALLGSFGELAGLWLYHNRFLKGKFYFDYSVVEDSQYFLSHALKAVEKALKSSHHKHIALKDVDELAHQVWFLPALSQPVFRLALRSVSCFLLKPLSQGKICEQSLQFKEKKITARFSDLIFVLLKDATAEDVSTLKVDKQNESANQPSVKDATAEAVSTLKDKEVDNHQESTHKTSIQESVTGKAGDHISLAELSVLLQYLDSWSQAEQEIRNKGGSAEVLSSLFGAPFKWINRKVDVQARGRLSFNVERTEDQALLSRLNWQSHLMQLSATAYTKRGKEGIDQNLWNVMIREWTALAVALYPPLKWEQFQSAGFQMFSHGDFITSQSNGDGILQDYELLELFALVTSSADLLLSALGQVKHCEGAPAYFLPKNCFFDTVQGLPSVLFDSFPVLKQRLADSEDMRSAYMHTLKSFYGENGLISHKDIFKTFLIIHYQENRMEHLDKDGSLDLNIQELMALMPVVEQSIIEEVPLVNDKSTALAFVTYLFYYGELPIVGEEGRASAPIRFSNWLLHPEKWKLKVDQQGLLKAIFLVSQSGPSLKL